MISFARIEAAFDLIVRGDIVVSLPVKAVYPVITECTFCFPFIENIEPPGALGSAEA